jgi:hypothetical protein
VEPPTKLYTLLGPIWFYFVQAVACDCHLVHLPQLHYQMLCSDEYYHHCTVYSELNTVLKPLRRTENVMKFLSCFGRKIYTSVCNYMLFHHKQITSCFPRLENYLLFGFIIRSSSNHVLQSLSQSNSLVRRSQWSCSLRHRSLSTWNRECRFKSYWGHAYSSHVRCVMCRQRPVTSWSHTRCACLSNCVWSINLNSEAV